MKESRWDIPTQVGFQKDLAYGKLGETLVEGMLTSLMFGSCEVKTDRYRNGRMVVEIEQNPRGKGWKSSGIAVTEAKWWIYVYSLDGSLVIIDVERLKRYIGTLPSKRLKTFAPMSDNPARGFLLMPEEVMDIMINPLYDAGSAQE